jgi:hypothetical protein
LILPGATLEVVRVGMHAEGHNRWPCLR